MANCCICGEKLGFMSGIGYSLRHNDVKICERCDLKRKHFESIKEEYELERAKTAREYFLQHIEKGTVSQVILNDLQKSLEGVLEREKELADKACRKTVFKVTTGYNFEKYNIVDYLDIASGEVVLGTGFFSELGAQVSDTFGTKSGLFEGKIATAKKAALDNMKDKALDMGANAIIGVDFDIMTFSNNMIAVSANGTAVIIEKMEQ